MLDDQGGLIDIYARADITALAAANAYNRLQWEDVTVGQALRLCAVSILQFPSPAAVSKPSIRQEMSLAAEPKSTSEQPSLLSCPPTPTPGCNGKNVTVFFVEIKIKQTARRCGLAR